LKRHYRELSISSRGLTLGSYMFGRLGQVARHLSRPVPAFAHSSAATFRSSLTSSVMAGATTTTQQKGLIHTAACLIIGDEVLGGKVMLFCLLLLLVLIHADFVIV
jgi:hypothetical protein